jgi:hypothetical protein
MEMRTVKCTMIHLVKTRNTVDTCLHGEGLFLPKVVELVELVEIYCLWDNMSHGTAWTPCHHGPPP